jgi:hypothetical protein
VVDTSKITSKKFTIKECGAIGRNQRAHDFWWLTKEKIKEAKRQSERHRKLREKIMLLQVFQRE